jgi:hypothetical protein
MNRNNTGLVVGFNSSGAEELANVATQSLQ